VAVASGAEDVLLALHLLAAALFVAGIVVAGLAQLRALRLERPSEIAGALRRARVGVVLVAVGSLAALGLGLGLVRSSGHRFGEAWVVASLCLWVASQALGGYGGRAARHARERAEHLAAAGDESDPEVTALVRHRPSLLASYASAACVAAIVVLMVLRPGS
jgi:uncharacterized membrane protein